MASSIIIFGADAASVPSGPLAITEAGDSIARSGGWLALNRNEKDRVRFRSLGEALKRESISFSPVLTGTPRCNREHTAFSAGVAAAETLMLEERAGSARQVSRQAAPDVPLPQAGVARGGPVAVSP